MKTSSMTESLKTFTLRVRVNEDDDDLMRQTQTTQAATVAHSEAADHAMRIVTMSQEVVNEVRINDDGEEVTNTILITTAECELVSTVGAMADNFEDAMTLACKQWPDVDWTNTRVIPVTERIHLAKLYGFRDMPFIVDPNIKILLWHRDVMQHVRAGRIVLATPIS